jgi:PASTA domain
MNHMRPAVATLVAFALLAACGKPPANVDVAATPPASAVPEADRLAVPQVNAVPIADADQILIKSGLIPILKFEPGVVTEPGTVINTEPPVGTLVTVGATVTVHIAGPPGNTIQDYVDAHRETFVGIGADTNGVMVVGVVQSADLAREMALLSQLANGRSFRLQTCARSWVELKRVQAELAKRRFLPDAEAMSFATAIDPLACAVRMTIDLPDAQIAELTGKYQGALVIQKGGARRAG